MLPISNNFRTLSDVYFLTEKWYTGSISNAFFSKSIKLFSVKKKELFRLIISYLENDHTSEKMKICDVYIPKTMYLRVSIHECEKEKIQASFSLKKKFIARS